MTLMDKMTTTLRVNRPLVPFVGPLMPLVSDFRWRPLSPTSGDALVLYFRWRPLFPTSGDALVINKMQFTIAPCEWGMGVNGSGVTHDPSANMCLLSRHSAGIVDIFNVFLNPYLHCRTRYQRWIWPSRRWRSNPTRSRLTMLVPGPSATRGKAHCVITIRMCG